MHGQANPRRDQRIPCEFFLIRYVPDVVKGEFVNIGVLLREAGPGTQGSAPLDSAVSVRFTRDWARVRCINPDADIALLESLEAEIISRLQSESKTEASTYRPILSVLEDTLSNSIQITAPRACLAESKAAELDQLMRLYVEPLRVKTARVRTGRAAIASTMRREFERVGAWTLMRKRISAALYTRAGDPMKLDCGYRPNGVVRIFHAVSLDSDVESAKGLAYTAPGLREGLFRIEGATLDLAAVIEPLRTLTDDLESEAAERYRFGVETMEREQVRVLTVSDLVRAAETARLELKL